MILAFSYDFIQSNQSHQCQTSNGNALKEFSYKPANTSIVSNDLTKCEEYCSRTQRCWGCIINCDKNCQAYAISSCNNLDKSTSSKNTSILQRPGINFNESIYMYLTQNYYVFKTSCLPYIVFFKTRRITFSLVCVDVKLTKIYGGIYGLRWTFGSCSSSLNYDNFLGHLHSYTERCCLPPGEHTLACNGNKKYEGWADSSLEIQGRQYCDDFIGYEAMRRIIVTGSVKVFWRQEKFYIRIIFNLIE